MSANRDRRRFTIEDAFEEETDDAIRVYGSTTERSPLKPKVRNNGTIPEDSIVVRIDNAEPRSPVPLKSPDDVSLTRQLRTSSRLLTSSNATLFLLVSTSGPFL
jgi:hypothetical protein